MANWFCRFCCHALSCPSRFVFLIFSPSQEPVVVDESDPLKSLNNEKGEIDDPRQSVGASSHFIVTVPGYGEPADGILLKNVMEEL